MVSKSKGRRFGRSGGLVLGCCLALLVAPAHSRAGGLFELDEAEFTLHGSHGYLITVVGFLGSNQSVTLYAERGPASVEYTVPGTVTEEELVANFGALGSIALHFEPSGRKREAIEYCDSTHPTVAVSTGTFVGTIDFRGERGYTRVSATRAQGGVGNSHALAGNRENAECRSFMVGGGAMKKAEFASLEAWSRKEGLYFTAIATTSVEGSTAPSATGSNVLVGAGSYTKENELEISRSVVIAAPVADFGFDDPLDRATVDPPAPFTGKATFRKTAGGKTSWSGSLAVPIPGLGRVPLTGPGFHAKISKSNGTVGP